MSSTTNGVTTSATYDAANQLTSWGVTSYSYDRNGNMVSRGGDSLTYDAANRWTGGTLNSLSLGFGYDARGQRVSRTRGASRTDFWYDSTGLSLETGATNATYQRGPYGIVLSINSGGATRNYMFDLLGTTTGLLTTDGNLSDTYGYDPNGRSNGGSSSAYNPIRYAGTYQDADTGLYQMGARYYDPDSGRFTQADPLPSQMLSNRYAYAGGDPVNYSDPTGLFHAGCDGHITVDQIFGTRVLNAVGQIACFSTRNGNPRDVDMREIRVCWYRHVHHFLGDGWEQQGCSDPFNEVDNLIDGFDALLCRLDIHYHARLTAKLRYHWYQVRNFKRISNHVVCQRPSRNS